MPICKHCNTKWTYKDSLKNMLRYKCPYCGEKNYIRKFRVRDILMMILTPAIVIFILPIFDTPFIGTIAIGLSLIAIYLLTYPINLELTKEEEPYF
ncbi:TIGR04104 family putative zinc finger protein [Pseudogracilibacillus auburnensis]|uniref:CXXC-20-CXXC protein n=1 Tax=Pseudogracilibacillus auburnensis TaxID=1494959 RepID=A0A2V3VQZ6_9BACI|nr:TIGR04104 family putative zinc finger protein [Pseudogracilibacillus auburnensis]MBO1005498.1 hypothetical protein [Pseudogracilibacillus auburnensis]PXW83574.1 CXXC-20-CXXC protein [Pseudogracilibacillus auburnensis]